MPADGRRWDVCIIKSRRQPKRYVKAICFSPIRQIAWCPNIENNETVHVVRLAHDRNPFANLVLVETNRI